MALYVPPKTQFEIGKGINQHIVKNLQRWKEEVPAFLSSLPGSPELSDLETAHQELAALLSIGSLMAVKSFFKENKVVADNITTYFLTYSGFIDIGPEKDTDPYFLDKLDEYQKVFALLNTDAQAEKSAFALAVATNLRVSIPAQSLDIWKVFINDTFASYLVSMDECIRTSLNASLHV